ncbi:hypothetical protein [uncultured Clostridium sp.]|uniref:hypothetical protein n=1 Tax=uncultured Clostridium sp. TaxID=59620 RepID=UPI0025858DDD|nr:hypothetical protein [uncultured Clostridium sp.]
MRILVISQEVWRDDKNGGNVLSNIFSGIDAEFAQIYCSPGSPSNSICKKYYQMTDSMIINNIIKKRNIGKILSYINFPNDDKKEIIAINENKKFYNFFRKYRLESFLVGKELLWSMSFWKNNQLKNFILDFNPDIIFAPCYASHFMLKIDRYIAELTKKPMVSYISDDNYSLKQFRFSPVYWINRLVLRSNMRKTFKYYNLIYTMTEEQLKECKEAFNCNIKILKKGGDFTEVSNKGDIKGVIKLVYAGGIYLGRGKTLEKISDLIRELNKDEKKFSLDIYTGNELTKRQKKKLNNGYDCNVHGLVDQKTLKEIYSNSHIALHIEGLDLKNKLITRISFSTKIIDLLGSGCAVIAVAWKRHSGYTYLDKEDAAICVDSITNLKEVLIRISNNSNIIKEYIDKAIMCGMRNHDSSIIKKNIQKDFNKIYKSTVNESIEN